MFLTELIREFLFDCKVRELSDLTVKNYEKQLLKFRHFVRENNQVIQFEELKPIHVKEYMPKKEDKSNDNSEDGDSQDYSNELDREDLFRISILDKDKIAVVFLKDDSRYVLERD